MFPITTVKFSFSIGEISSPDTPDAIALPPERQAGMYVYIKPCDQNEPWFWGVLTKEIDAERSVWAYERREPCEIIEHIEKELREKEIVVLPDLDALLSLS